MVSKSKSCLIRKNRIFVIKVIAENIILTIGTMSTTRTFLAAILCLLALCGCHQKKGYYIKGSVDSMIHLDGKLVFLQLHDDIKLDSTVVRNGRFSFKGESVDTAVLAYISTYELDLPSLDFVLENGEIIANIGKNTATGTKLNDANTKYNATRIQINQEFLEFIQELQSDSNNYTQLEIEKKLTEAFDKMQSREAELASDLFTEHHNDALGVKSFLALLHNRPDDAIRALELKEMAGPVVQKNKQISKALALYDNLVSSRVGNHFKEVVGIDTSTGDTLRLSKYLGQDNYTLVDFWSSWCAPCRDEIPYLKNAYEKYSKRGLQVVSIAVWDTPEQHKAALAKLEISWPQIFDNSENSDATFNYGITGIPQILLIDPKGKIVHRNLRGEDILRKLEEVYPSKNKNKTNRRRRK